MRKSISLVVLAASVILWGVACGGSGSDCSTNPDYATCVAPIMEKSCVNTGCHSGDTPAGGLNLKGVSASDLVGKDSTANAGSKTVVAGSADTSVLYLKLLAEGDRANAVAGGRMPLGTPLSDADLAIVKAWIQGGAK